MIGRKVPYWTCKDAEARRIWCINRVRRRKRELLDNKGRGIKTGRAS